MSERFSIKQGATLPAISYELLEDKAPKDVSAATVTWSSRLVATKAAHVTAGATSFVTDGTDGKVAYTFSTLQTGTPGIYEGEWIVDYGGGAVAHWPTEGFIEFEIKADI